MSRLILKKAVVIDGTGADPVVNGSVVVEGERIPGSGRPKDRV
jgi:hypothetical protein